MERNNIILIGMPASGKSTVGVILAKVLGMDFIDADIVIQQRENTRLSCIIEERGIDSFLKCEEDAILSINAHNTVVATGGSAVYSDTAMKHLAQGSKIVYLKVPKSVLLKRLKNIKERGVVLRPGETLEDMFDARCELYEKYADITVTAEGLSIEDTLDAVRKALSGAFEQ